MVRNLILAAALVAAMGGGGCCDMEIDTDELPSGVVDMPYAFELKSSCGGDLWYLSAGTLPPGISLTADGELSGIPTRAGEYLFTIGVDEFSGDRIEKGFALTVHAPPPAP